MVRWAKRRGLCAAKSVAQSAAVQVRARASRRKAAQLIQYVQSDNCRAVISGRRCHQSVVIPPPLFAFEQVPSKKKFAPFAKGDIPQRSDPIIPPLFQFFGSPFRKNDLRQARRDLIQSCHIGETRGKSICLNVTPPRGCAAREPRQRKMTLECCDCEGHATCYSSTHPQCASFYVGISQGCSGPFPVNQSRSCRILSISL